MEFRVDLRDLKIAKDAGTPIDQKALHIIINEFCSLQNDYELATRLRMDRCTLQRNFKSSYHITPKQLRDYLRIQKALHLIRVSDLKLKEIAYECGFDNYLGFWRVFRSRLGMHPLFVKSDDISNIEISQFFE